MSVPFAKTESPELTRSPTNTQEKTNEEKSDRQPIPTPPKNLITDDGEPLESNRHRIAINVLIDSLNQAFAQRTDFFAGGNMFIYFSEEQVRNREFRGPDFFVVLNIDGTYPRQCWPIWEEAGRYPNVIVELLSESTANEDLTTKKNLYEETFRTPDYFVYDPFDPNSLRGWHLDERQKYQPIAANANGWLWSRELGLWLGTWEGIITRQPAPWLRFYDEMGNLVPLPDEAERQRADRAEQAQLNAIPQLLATGMSIEQVAEILSLSVEIVRQVSEENE